MVVNTCVPYRWHMFDVRVTHTYIVVLVTFVGDTLLNFLHFFFVGFS